MNTRHVPCIRVQAIVGTYQPNTIPFKTKSQQLLIILRQAPDGEYESVRCNATSAHFARRYNKTILCITSQKHNLKISSMFHTTQEKQFSPRLSSVPYMRARSSCPRLNEGTTVVCGGTTCREIVTEWFSRMELAGSPCPMQWAAQ